MWKVWVGALVVVLTAGRAQAQEEYFPKVHLDMQASVELLAAEAIGPPAERYDHDTVTPDSSTQVERAVEQALLGDRAAELQAPDSLRRYARILQGLLRQGQPQNIHRWFLGEHCGLVHPATSLGTFVVGGEDPEAIAEMLKPLIASVIKDEELTAIAVTLEEVEGGRVGSVTATFETIDFEPFERVYEPGAVAAIPGTALTSKSRYELFVTYPGAEVREFELAGEGSFDIEVPLPREPGAYRVALSRLKKKKAPDSPFFFTLYVGEPAPTGFSFQLPERSVQRTLDEVENDYIDRVNAERQALGLAALEIVGSRQEMRDMLAGAPEREGPRYRFLSKALLEDPAPDTPHGLWDSAWGGGVDSADAAWMAMEHPITRGVLLHEPATMVKVGAQADLGGWLIASTLLEPPPDGDEARSRAWSKIAERWKPKKSEPLPAPALQAALDHLAQKVADGDLPMKKAFKEILRYQKEGKILGGAVSMAAMGVPPGAEPDVSNVKPVPGARFLAIGHGSGDMGAGNGLDQSVLIVVTTTQAQ